MPFQIIVLGTHACACVCPAVKRPKVHTTIPRTVTDHIFIWQLAYAFQPLLTKPVPLAYTDACLQLPYPIIDIIISSWIKDYYACVYSNSNCIKAEHTEKTAEIFVAGVFRPLFEKTKLLLDLCVCELQHTCVQRDELGVRRSAGSRNHGRSQNRPPPIPIFGVIFR
jgi:hypothetical protein